MILFRVDSFTLTELEHASSHSHFKCLEGTLKKKNSKGEWKDRRCFLTDEIFVAFKTTKKGISKEIKEFLDVKVIQEAHVTDDVLEIKLVNGEVYLFKGSPSNYSNSPSSPSIDWSNDSDEWRRALTVRIDWALSKVSSTVSNKEKVHISGKLLKKSHNKYHLQMQVLKNK